MNMVPVPSVIRYEAVSWMQVVSDKSGGKYYALGNVLEMRNTLAVTPVHGNGLTLFYCTRHQQAYHHKLTCPDCSGGESE